MRTKSLPIRFSWKSLDLQFRNRIEKSEGYEEIVTDTCDVSQKKRHCVGTSETGKGGFECIVCGVSDLLVYRCSGADCIISFHGECLTSEFGGSDDLANPFCPYCWFKFVALKSKSLREKAIEAEKAVFKYLNRGMEEKDSDRSNMPLTEQQEEEEGIGKSEEMKEDEVVASGEQERVAKENFQERCVVKKGEVSRLSSLQEPYAGKEHDQILQNEKQRRRRRVVLNDDTDSEISSTEERIREDVTEQITSSLLEKTTNQQKRLTAVTTKVVATKSKTPREVSVFKKDHRRRLLWTSKEEEMLKVGVEKFGAEANKNIPWRKILKMGENVFHKNRSSADLKDKWRNMIKLM